MTDSKPRGRRRNPDEPPYYQLTELEWVEVTQICRYAETRVLYYLRCLDPFGNRKLKVRVIDIAAAIGLKKGTVSKALKALDNKEYIDLEIDAATVQVSSRRLPNTHEPEAPNADNDWADFTAEVAPEFFDWVLLKKIPKLPVSPASPRSAAEGWIRKQGTQLYTEYQQWVEAQNRTAQPPSREPEAEETPTSRLTRYQQLWPNAVCRPGITKAIADNPQWGLVIGPNGPQEMNHAHD